MEIIAQTTHTELDGTVTSGSTIAANVPSFATPVGSRGWVTTREAGRFLRATGTRMINTKELLAIVDEQNIPYMLRADGTRALTYEAMAHVVSVWEERNR